MVHAHLRSGRWSASGPAAPPGSTGLLLLGSLPFLDPQLHSNFSALAPVWEDAEEALRPQDARQRRSMALDSAYEIRRWEVRGAVQRLYGKAGSP
ncbi:hypothetical protein CDL15_Pgr017732 [Punica granatum]|nr:hypothetical protein CDL15_Pgr017732 [Punica granatum]